jgi:hypothetical protein
MHLDSAQTYHVIYVWVGIVYIAYTISLVVRARKARASVDQRDER